MATSRVTKNSCVTCIQNSDEQKAKPGITLCEGCHQSFCLSHFIEHRQTLSNKLDGIAGQRDVLRSRIEELPTKISKDHLKTINDWENMMLQTVTEAASNARQQVQQLLMTEMERECNELTSKITSFLANDDYFETDIEEIQVKIEKLNEELNDISGLKRIQFNLPTIDCSNMIHIKPFETQPSLEITKRNDSIMLEPKEEYHSFIEQFLTTHSPSTDLSTYMTDCSCASPTMLITIYYNVITRLVFHRQSTSTFEWKHEQPLAIRWSFWLQQFIVLTSKSIVVVDAVEKVSAAVQEMHDAPLKYMAHWKDLCLVTDSQHRLFLHKMNKNLAKWSLLYCWSSPTTCASDENITAIGLNEHHIVLSVQCGDEYRFAVHYHDMTHCSHIQLAHPCTSIQALPLGKWLIYDSSKNLYYVMDRNLEHHDEPYLSSWKDFYCIISCDETNKVFLVFTTRRAAGNGYQITKQVIVYTNNCLP